MGLSGGSKSESYSGSAQKWAQPYATAAAGNVQGVYNANAAGTQRLANQVQGLVPGLLDRFNSGNPNLSLAKQYNSDVLSGKYMSGNPYLQNVINATNRDVINGVDSQFATAGRYGSGAFTDVLSRNLADAENQARMSDYNTQMSRMDQAAQQAPTLAQADYIGLPEILQTAQSGAELPYTGTTSYANALSALFNGGNQIQTQSGGLFGGLGSILSGVGAMGSGGIFKSDSRLKSEIEKVGELPDGLGVYEWKYVPWGARHRGVMADEVAQLRPWALVPGDDGFASVDYSKLEAA